MFTGNSRSRFTYFDCANVVCKVKAETGSVIKIICGTSHGLKYFDESLFFLGIKLGIFISTFLL